ncbi:MAG: substrate-binding domain-containing protein [Alphaproteobacteria bacterium]|nr:substrate-binding domain-containing protein [Alphaproteobacteria bacterium]
MPATIRILSAGAPKLGIGRCASTFARKTGHEVDVAFATAPVLREQVEKGEAEADLLVAPVPFINDCVASGRVERGTEIIIGSVTAGVTVRAGAPLPDISTADTLKAALLAADAVFYNTASSGLHIADMIERMGIAEQIESKTERFPNGAAVLVRLAEGKAPCEIAFGQITEIRRFEGGGISLVGPLPKEVGKKTTYAAGLLVGAAPAESARALLAFMDTAEARQIYAEAGLE